jgi:hypothetical protein
MIAPKSTKEYPKYLRCNETIKSWTWNKYFTNPWSIGELVMVAPETEQHSCKYVGSPDKVFRRNYVVVYRKDESGKFTKKQTAEWRQFDLISRK